MKSNGYWGKIAGYTFSKYNSLSIVGKIQFLHGKVQFWLDLTSLSK